MARSARSTGQQPGVYNQSQQQHLHSQFSRRRFLKASASAVAGMGLSSCGWTLANVRSAPTTNQPSDTLYIYTWSDYTDEILLENFQAQTGFKVVSDVFDSNETMLARIQAGGGAAYSILYPSDYMVAKMIELELLQPLEQSRLIGLDNLLPNFRKLAHDPDNGYSITVSWGTTGLIYNPELLSEPPQDWQYLWNHRDKLARRFTLLNDVREVMGATLRSLGYSYNSTNPTEIRAAFEKLMELKPAIASFTTDTWRPLILAGDLSIAMAYSSDAASVIEENPKLKYIVPSSGTSLWGDAMVIPKTAPNLEAAYAWINYMLQPAVAAELCKRLLFATPNQAAIEILPKTLQVNKTLFPPQAALEKSESLAPVGDATELYDQYWTRLTSS